MDWGIVGGITGIISLVLVMLAAGRYLGTLDDLIKRHAVCPIVTVDKDIAVLKARFDMFLATIEKHVPERLIQPHTPQRDVLLRKLSQHELSETEARELLADIEDNLDSFGDNQKVAAILIVVRLKDLVNGWS